MIWFDLDNSPHVPLFRPVFAELQKRRLPYLVTARDFAQTKDLLRYWNIDHRMLGVHGGKSRIRKIINLVHRSNTLVKEVRRKNIKLAVSHGSRTQVVAAKRLRIPSLLMIDYEYTETRIFNLFASWLLVPSLIPEPRLARAGFNLQKVIRYSGFKEEIYLRDFVPDPTFRRQIGLADDQILVTIRPPSTTSNYHEEKSSQLFQRCLECFSADPRVICLVLSRTEAELKLIPSTLRAKENILILQQPVDGLQLLWHSDLVISGGGTVNREAALLGVPTYSIFAGPRPYLDEYLESAGRLRFLENFGDIDKMQLEKRRIDLHYQPTNPQLASSVTDTIVGLSGRGD